MLLSNVKNGTKICKSISGCTSQMRISRRSKADDGGDDNDDEEDE